MRLEKLRALTAPTLDDFEHLARETYDALPREFRDLCGEIVFRVEDFADEDMLDEMDVDSDYDLTGLFVGSAVGARDADPMPREPNMIFLYRIPIVAEWAETGVELGALVAHVIIHEIGHHFGLSDEDIERIEADAGED